MKPHVCVCGDCNPEPFADVCKYEAEVERLLSVIARIEAAAVEAGTDLNHEWVEDACRLARRGQS